MIRVIPADEPRDFNEKVRNPGLRAISELVGDTPAFARTSGRPFGKVADNREDIPSDKFPSYWTKCLDDLMTACNQICAYACFRIHSVTGSRSVDHMAPKSRSWDCVYEWSNYRLASSLLNARKQNFEDVLDPFEIQNGWFQLELVGFQVLPDPKLSSQKQDEINSTIARLRLNGWNFRSSRARDAENYWAGKILYEVLMEESPFVAMELRRQKRLSIRSTNE